MQQHIIYESLKAKKQSHQCGFAVLADPDKTSVDDTVALADLCNEAGVDYLFLGGSLLMQTNIDATIAQFKKASNIPVILFPGSPAQVSPNADALLYLSLISGRNPELLIGQHVTSAPLVKKSGLEVRSTGYILIDGGTTTTVSYISNTRPIPADKPGLCGHVLAATVHHMGAEPCAWALLVPRRRRQQHGLYQPDDRHRTDPGRDLYRGLNRPLWFASAHSG